MTARHPFNVALGAQLAAARSDAGMSKYAVELATGRRFRTSHITAYERGDRGIRIATLYELCRLYDASAAAVLHQAEELLAEGQEAAA